MPAPGVCAGLLDGVFGVPAELARCFFGAGIAGGNVARATVYYFVGHAMATGFAKSSDKF